MQRFLPPIPNPFLHKERGGKGTLRKRGFEERGL